LPYAISSYLLVFFAIHNFSQIITLCLLFSHSFFVDPYKEKNRLLHKRLNAIVFVSYNRKMKTRFQIRREKKGNFFDPLVIDQFDWDNEWADCCCVHPQGVRGCEVAENENGLTWELVDEALGASSSL